MSSIYRIYPDERCIESERECRLDERQRKNKQHTLKIHMEKYFKDKLGKGPENTRIIILNDMLVIRGERFLTEPEKFIVKTDEGSKVINQSRMHVARQHSIDNKSFIEKLLGAKAIHETYMVEAENDFWMHVIVFDRVLVD